MTLETEFERVSLPLENPFTIFRGTQTDAENVIVKIADEAGMTGVGGAAPSAHYGETADTVEAVLPDLLDAVERVGDPTRSTRSRPNWRPSSTATRRPRRRLDRGPRPRREAARRPPPPSLGARPTAAPATSYTIGLDETERVREKAEAAVDAGYPILKIKLGTDRDRELIDAVREAAPDARLRVDANEAWTPARRSGSASGSPIATWNSSSNRCPPRTRRGSGLRAVGAPRRRRRVLRDALRHPRDRRPV